MANSAALQYPGNRERIDYLDGWRGLAIAFVLQEHFLKLAGYDRGFLGVDIFFCLSGMLMSHILFERRVSLAAFYKRRVSQILPVFVLFVLAVYGTAAFFRQPFTPTEFLATLFFLRTYLPADFGIWQPSLPIGHLWSLNVEEHCYVLLGLVTLLALSKGRIALLLLLLGFAAIGMQYAYEHGLIPEPRDGEIRTETAAAYLLLSAGYSLVRERVSPYVKPWMPVCAFLAAMPFYWRSMEGGIAEFVTPVLLAFAVNHLRETGDGLRRALAFGPLRLLGIWSFSIYLWQQPFFQYKAAMPPGVAFAGALLAGIASFYLFENPIRTWLNRNW